MGKIKITPSGLCGSVTIPPSKSQAHRALLCAALAKGESWLHPIARSKDMEATIGALRQLGAVITRKGDGVLVDGRGMFQPADAVLDCLESGSTLRFLVPIAAAGGVSAAFIGHGRLPERPIGAFLTLLPEHGVACRSAGGLPLQISGALRPGCFALAGNVSSQYVTGLLLALPLLDADSEIVLTTPLESKGYVDMTLDVMRAFGIQVQERENGYGIPGGQSYRCRDYTVEGDWSQAAFFLCAGAIGGEITLNGLRTDSLQGDRAVLSVLQEMGANVLATADTVRVRRAPLHGVTVDVRQIPDLVPALAVACAFAQGESRICGGERLRLKESDRIATTVAGLRAIGAAAQEQPDGMVIQGVPLHGGEVDGANDHRIVMAFAVAGANLAHGTTVIRDWESIAKSYPDFFDDFRALGGVADVIRMGE